MVRITKESTVSELRRADVSPGPYLDRADRAMEHAIPQTMRREVIPLNPQSSVRAVTHDFPSAVCGWGFHPEYEIHLITSTRGTFIAGDHIGTFRPGHVSLIGPNLPHDWVSDLPDGEIAVDRDAVVHFTDDWVRGALQHLPELAETSELLRRSSRGLVFSGATAKRASQSILACVNARGMEQLAHLFQVLAILANAPSEEYQVVASKWMGRPTDVESREVGQLGLNYIFENLAGTIRLSTAAQLAYMSQATFAKYFRAATGMTFSNMVKKLRVASARRLLDTTDHAVGQVAAMSGYNNMANFNRQFLAEVGMTPSAYRRLETSQKPPPEIFSLDLRAPSE